MKVRLTDTEIRYLGAELSMAFSRMSQVQRMVSAMVGLQAKRDAADAVMSRPEPPPTRTSTRPVWTEAT